MEEKDPSEARCESCNGKLVEDGTVTYCEDCGDVAHIREATASENIVEAMQRLLKRDRDE